MSTRQIFLDTETTGKSSRTGDRVVEIAAIEVENGVRTGRIFHVYLNPDGKQMDDEVIGVHGITNEFLLDKPKFRDVAADFVKFIDGAEIIAHNASFDVEFLHNELKNAGIVDRSFWEIADKVTDTLSLSRNVVKGLKGYSLDKLCDHFKIDRSHRDKHSAMVDTDLLVEVYQRVVENIDLNRPMPRDNVPRSEVRYLQTTPVLKAIGVSAEDEQRHREFLERNKFPSDKIETVARPTPKV